MRWLERAADSWCVSQQSHDAPLAVTPFIYLCLTAKVYWYRPVLSSGISWKEQYMTCAALVSGVYFGKVWEPGDREGGCIPGPAFQGLVVVFPVENETVKKKRSFVLTGPLDISVIAISPIDSSFMWMVWCELLSSLWFVLFMVV